MDTQDSASKAAPELAEFKTLADAGFSFTDAGELATVEDESPNLEAQVEAAQDEAVAAVAELALEDVARIEATYEAYYEQGMLRVLDRTVNPIVPENSEQFLCLLIATKIYRARMSGALAVLQWALCMWVAASLSLVFLLDQKPGEAANNGLIPGFVVGTAVALLEVPKKKREAIAQATELLEK